jgi:dTDP-4-dehydrorhamnose 3,5-epimerase
MVNLFTKCEKLDCKPYVTSENPFQFSDIRGDFVKFFEAKDDSVVIKEAFYTFTKSGFIRGMHLQVGPGASSRHIFIKSGSVHTAFIDLRATSPSYLHVCEFVTPALTQRRFFVPPGVAHGFQAISDCEIIYISDKRYSPNYDTGINPKSINVSWSAPVTGLSDRDSNLPDLESFLKLY